MGLGRDTAFRTMAHRVLAMRHILLQAVFAPVHPAMQYQPQSPSIAKAVFAPLGCSARQITGPSTAASAIA